MRVLVTNDDGVEAPGIAALVAGLIDAHHDVVVVAPLTDASGAGTGTGPQRREVVDRFACVRTQVGGAPAFGLDALPSLCVTAGCAGAFGEPPELVVSGVNAGRNVGRSVLHSGTVGAALTAAQLGWPAIAASAQTRGGRPAVFAPAVALTTALIDEKLYCDGVVLNCNTPDRELAEIQGVRLAPLGDANLIAAARVVGSYLEMEFLRQSDGEAETDEILTERGFATLTPIAGLRVERSGALDRLVAALDALERRFLR
ncbi:MAG: 5'/3'-nucleotidase SurE [Actinomycetota bacterium]|nr:5'/3'-nucleotidase SurE [Actinomycetota bacterium]